MPSTTERIALISDVHGNLTALEAVLDDIGARGITRIINLGDHVGNVPRLPRCTPPRTNAAGTPGDVEAELAHARAVDAPAYDGWEAELRHGIYRGSMHLFAAGRSRSAYYHGAPS